MGLLLSVDAETLRVQASRMQQHRRNRRKDIVMTGLPAKIGDAARAYVEGMPNGEIVAFPITALDGIGLPVWIVALFPEDPRLADIMPYGRRLRDQRRGGGPRRPRRVRGNDLFRAYAAANYAHAGETWSGLVSSLGTDAVADPLTLGLPAGSPVSRDTVLDLDREPSTA